MGVASRLICDPEGAFETRFTPAQAKNLVPEAVACGVAWAGRKESLDISQMLDRIVGR
jgi:hypothetical protein